MRVIQEWFKVYRRMCVGYREISYSFTKDTWASMEFSVLVGELRVGWGESPGTNTLWILRDNYIPYLNNCILLSVSTIIRRHWYNHVHVHSFRWPLKNLHTQIFLCVRRKTGSKYIKHLITITHRECDWGHGHFKKYFIFYSSFIYVLF